MHYCLLTTGNWRGNASTVRLREFGAELAKRPGVSVSFVLDDTPTNREDAGALHGITLAYVPRTTRHEFAERRRQIRRLAPDYVHVLNPHPRAFLALAGTRVPVVGDWDEWPAMRPYTLPRKLGERFLDRWLRRRSTVHVVCSRYLEREFRARFGLQAHYIPYATYLQNVEEGPSPFHAPTCVYLGNLYPAYDHDLVIHAMKQLWAATPDITLEVIGDGPDGDRWRSYVADEKLGNVTMLGYLTGQPLWNRLRHATCLLFPIRDTLLNRARCPSKTFAYMQARRPIITNRVGEVAEALGEKAIYVDPTPEGFAARISRVCSQGTFADIDYGIESFTWARRTDDLLAALGTASRAKSI